MKKLLFVLGLMTLSTAAQAKGLGPAGCGLGNQFFGTENQILAATTNGTSGNQTFGITSGTSNCVDAKGMAKLDAFVEANQVALANDVARGQGDTLAGLSKILGCQDQSQVGSVLKQNYQSVFTSEEASAQDVSQNIRRVIGTHQVACAG